MDRSTSIRPAMARRGHPHIQQATAILMAFAILSVVQVRRLAPARATA